MAKEKVLKYEKEMREFLEIMKWKDVNLDVDADNQVVSFGAGVNVGSQSGRAIIEANSDSDLFDFYIYFSSIN